MDRPPIGPETAKVANTIARQRADIGAANENDRSLAPLSPISLGGNANDVRLLSPALFDRGGFGVEIPVEKILPRGRAAMAYRALRGVGSRWARILWSCWTDNTT